MSDRDEILDVISTYAHAVDDRDIDRIVGCFTADGRMEFEGGESVAVSHNAIRAAFEQAFTAPLLAPPSTSTHVMANTLVTIDGDRAHAETQGVAHLASAALDKVVTRGLRYSDDLRRDDRWRIVRRVHRSIWQAEAPGH